MKLNVQFSYLGTWHDSTPVVTYYSLIKLGNDQNYGIVLGGWSFSGWNNTVFQTVNIAILDQNQDGTLKINTSKYISDPTTNGEGSVIAYDFNGDGRQDIFLAAYNESPFKPMSSTLYLSQQEGSFKKIPIADSVEAHDAIFCLFNGIPTVVTAGYGPTDPYYQFNSSTNTFDIKTWGNTYSGSLSGSCAILGDFNGDGKSELVIGDMKTGPGYDYNPLNSYKLAVYTLNGSNLSNIPAFITSLYFDQARYQNQGIISNYGPNQLSHNYRVWTDDFNHDGKLDILAAVQIFGPNTYSQKSKLEMFQNNGNLKFADVTDGLAQADDENTINLDYSMQIIDIDHSGINTYLSAGQPYTTVSQQANYIFVNDGTGKLYNALHDQFENWASILKTQYPNWWNTGTASFIPYQTANGLINFLVMNTNADLYNFPIQYNLTKDFTQDIMISDRNQSKLMRTWAGNDTFYDTNANSQAAHIDGGLGTNVSIYSDKSSAYTVTVNNSVEVKHVKIDASPNVDDTLVNIQKIQFSDLTLDTTMFTKTAALSSSQIVNLVELYIASFNRAPDSVGLDYWGSRLSDGMSLQDIAKSFFVQPETVAAYPTTMATSDFVTKVYNNVLSRGPDKGGLDYWVGELNTGHVTKDSFLLAIINGAMAATGSAVDRQTLANKESVGAYYALTQGLNNSTTWAKDVMSAVTDQMTTVTAANAKTDGYAAIAANPATSDLVVKLVGVAV